ncbi:hypothetical protein SDC9_94193 [bioreactor metagenome]|uniref:Uncharacterized protein n=1 Tax=bioreactor metagenome TaxID=1076179 RepID=A0A645A369_9ZZZZ
MDVISHISQLLYNTWVALCKDVLVVVTCFIIKIVYGSLIAPHVPLVEQEESFDFAAVHCLGNLGGSRGDNFTFEFVLPARDCQ